jgi:hypothetical protein
MMRATKIRRPREPPPGAGFCCSPQSSCGGGSIGWASDGLCSGTRRLPVLQRPPHGPDGRPSHRSRDPAGARGAVVDLGAEAAAGHARRPARGSRPAAAEAPASLPRGVCTNHKLRRAVTALAIGNIGKQREAVTGGHGNEGHGTEGCCDENHATLKPRSHDTSRIARAKLMARVGEEFPLECPACGGDIRLIAFITEPGPIRKILTHLGEPLAPPPVSPARGPPTNWGELVQVHDDRDIFQASPNELPAIDIHSL